jgi:hypothetical protein
LFIALKLGAALTIDNWRCMHAVAGVNIDHARKLRLKEPPTLFSRLAQTFPPIYRQYSPLQLHNGHVASKHYTGGELFPLLCHPYDVGHSIGLPFVPRLNLICFAALSN